jgi:hypothetical protein
MQGVPSVWWQCSCTYSCTCFMPFELCRPPRRMELCLPQQVQCRKLEGVQGVSILPLIPSMAEQLSLWSAQIRQSLVLVRNGAHLRLHRYGIKTSNSGVAWLSCGTRAFTQSESAFVSECSGFVVVKSLSSRESKCVHVLFARALCRAGNLLLTLVLRVCSWERPLKPQYLDSLLLNRH